jgi:CRP-like cAMP-binding protein
MSRAERIFEPGEVIIREGEEGTEAFLIKSGRVKVTKLIGGHQVVLAILGPGQVFGEMALIEDKPRSATVTALEKGSAVVLDREAFAQLFIEQPKALIPLMRTFFERLRILSELWAEHETRQIPAITTDPEPRVRLQALTREARQALGAGQMEVKTFPFYVGRQSRSPSSALFDHNDLAIADQEPFMVSRNHCAIIRLGSSVAVLDRGSRLGTIVDGQRLGPERRHIHLSPGTHSLILGPEISPYRFNLIIEQT